MAGETESGDAARLAAHAMVLGDGIDAALGPWVEHAVARIATAYFGSIPAGLAAEAATAGERARSDIGTRVRSLLAQDVDEQRTTPLALVRGAVRYPTEVLQSAGVPPVVRDELAESAFPDDDYDLSPAAFADLGPDLAEPGLVWGAAKAHVVLRRRKGEW